MAENTTTTTDEEVTEHDDVLEGPAGSEDALDDAAADAGTVPGIGAVSGGFGFAGLVFALVSLITPWTSGVMVSHSQYNAEVNAGSSGMGPQQQLDLAVSGWHTQAWWALGFAVAAVLFGVGSALLPRLRKNGTPGWAQAAATGAVIVGLVGVVLAVLTVTGVIGGTLTAAGAS